MTTRTVIGTWKQSNQSTAAAGKIHFLPVQRVIASGEYIALPAPAIVATLNNQGAISVNLPVTDEGEPEGWLWQVIEDIGYGSSRYYIEVPASASPLDLTTVVPVDVADGGPAYTAFTPQSRTLTAGTGLTGGGDLSANRTIGIATGGVGTSQLADDAVTADKLATGSVTSDAIAEGTVIAADVADGAVTTAKIADDAVTAAKIAANAVGSSELADASVDTAALQDGAVTNGKLAGSIDPAKVTGTAVVTSDARLSDARTPTAHKTSHATGGTDALSPADIGAATAAQGTLADGAAQKASNLSDLANSATALSNLGGTPTSRTITAGTGLTGGGDLSANRTLSVTGLTNAEIASNAAIASSKLADLPYSVVVPGTVAPTANSGGVTTTYLGTSIYNVTVSTLSQNNYMEWTVWCAAGTYTLRTIYRALSSGGILSISIDGGAALGTTIDSYNAADVRNNISDITGIALAAGLHTVRYTASTKNASSSSYNQILHGLGLHRTGA